MLLPPCRSTRFRTRSAISAIATSVDRIKPAVGATPQWSGEPVLVVRIVRDARRFVAEIPLRFWAGTVASDLLDVSLVEQYFDPAIYITKIAGCLVPCTGCHGDIPW